MTMNDRSAARSVTVGVKRALGSATLLALTTFMATSALAQETAKAAQATVPQDAAEPAGGGGAETLEAITVTGSRIAREPEIGRAHV